MNSFFAFIIAIGAPSVIGAIIAILRYRASGTLQSTVDFLVVVVLLCIPLVFYQSGISGLYGIAQNSGFNADLQQVGILSGAIAILMIFWSIYSLEIQYSRYPTSNRDEKRAIAEWWLLALAGTAALWGMHVFAALNGGGFPPLW